MNRDQIRGAARHLKGRAQTAIGGLTGDPVRQVRGAVDQLAGGAQYAYGKARERAEDLADDGRHLAHEARQHADRALDEGRRIADDFRGRAESAIHEGRERAMEARRRGSGYGSRAVGKARDNRGHVALGVAALALAAGLMAGRNANRNF